MQELIPVYEALELAYLGAIEDQRFDEAQKFSDALVILGKVLSPENAIITPMRERVISYLSAKEEVNGLHPEVIHVIHASGGKHELRVSDLKALLASPASPTIAAAIEKMEAIRPNADCPELSEHAYRQAVDDCIAILRECGGEVDLDAGAWAIMQLRLSGPMTTEWTSPRNLNRIAKACASAWGLTAKAPDGEV